MSGVHIQRRRFNNFDEYSVWDSFSSSYNTCDKNKPEMFLQ